MWNNKRRMFLLLIILFIVIGISVSYAFFSSDFSGTTTQKVVINGIEFKYNETGNAISLQNQESISDANGMISENYFDFEVSLKSSEIDTTGYVIYITEDSTSTLSKDAVKLYLTDQDNVQIFEPTLVSGLTVYDIVPNSYLLHSTTITSSNNIKMQ